MFDSFLIRRAEALRMMPDAADFLAELRRREFQIAASVGVPVAFLEGVEAVIPFSALRHPVIGVSYSVDMMDAGARARWLARWRWRQLWGWLERIGYAGTRPAPSRPLFERFVTFDRRAEKWAPRRSRSGPRRRR